MSVTSLLASEKFPRFLSLALGFVQWWSGIKYPWVRDFSPIAGASARRADDEEKWKSAFKTGVRFGRRATSPDFLILLFQTFVF